MKKFFSLGLIATVLAVFTFSSCSKDDDDDSIVGKWALTSMKLEGNGISFSYDVDEGYSETLEFKSDGTCISTSEFDGDKDVATGKYSVSGNVLSVTDEDGTEKINFSVSGNTLTLYNEGYYDASEDEFLETQPAGKDYPKVKMSMIYKRK